MFQGLSAFPLTPVVDGRLDERSLERLVSALASSGVDSIGALGSTGSYAYLPREERRRAARTAVAAAGDVPVLVGVGAPSTREVLQHVEDAAGAGALGALLAPVSYQPLTEEEVHGLFEAVTARSEVPVVVYDNPATTGFTFSDELLGRIAHLPRVASIKLSALPLDPAAAGDRLGRLRALVPPHVTLGISGDGAGARGLLAGCDAWYSVLGGLSPRRCARITRAALRGDRRTAVDLSAALEPIWALFARFGSYRVASALAVECGLLPVDSVQAPVLPLAGDDREAVRAALRLVGGLD